MARGRSRRCLSVRRVADDIYEDPRLAAIYDDLDPDRGDLAPYLAVVVEFGAREVLDIGCGTGTFALLLAARGVVVTGLDPAGASLDVARGKPGAETVTWIHGDIAALPATEVDLVTMTANAAQAILDPADWRATLQGAFDVLRPGGHLVFETRDPARRAWESWGREQTHAVTNIDGVGDVEVWCDVTGVDGQLVSFGWTHVFAVDGVVLVSDSTIRFRERAEVAEDLTAVGYVVDEIRDAPDRPGREFVFVARKP